METTAADDKIQAVVRLVLQAVDQRLETVREQLVQVTHTIASNHADINRRIDECHQMVAALQSGAASQIGSSVGTRSGSGANPSAVAALTEQVASLQARLDEMASARAADLAAALANVAPPRVAQPAVVPQPTPAAQAVPPAQSVAAAQSVPAAVAASPSLPFPTPAVPPTERALPAERIAPTVPPPERIAPSIAPAPMVAAPSPLTVPAAGVKPKPSTPTIPAAAVAPTLAPSATRAAPAAEPVDESAVATGAPAPIRPLTRVVASSPRVKSSSSTIRVTSPTAAPSAAAAAPASPEPAEPAVDFASLNEQISARLAAAVDRALGELGTPGLPSKSA